jgi:hypothetical protein
MPHSKSLNSRAQFMLLVFICLTFLATLILGCFLYFRLRRNSDNASTEVSLMVQYKTFIDLALSENAGARLMPAKSNTVLIQAKDVQGITTFSLSKVQGKIIVVWGWSSPNFGKRGKEWSFSDKHDQANMYLEVKKTLDTYLTSLYHQHNLTAPANKE